MKNLVCALFFLLLPLMVFSQIAVQDTLYVWASSGLNLRASAAKTAEKLVTIPFGGEVVATDITEKYFLVEEELGTIDGRWLGVKYKDYTGYVFSGYLNSFPTPNDAEDDLTYFKRIFGPVQMEYETVDSIQKSTTQTILLKHGITISTQRYQEEDRSAFPTIFLPQLSHRNAKLFAKHLYASPRFYDQREAILTYDAQTHTIKVTEQEEVGCFFSLQLLQSATGGGATGVVISQYCGC